MSTATLILGKGEGRDHITVQKHKLLIVSGALLGQEIMVNSNTFTIGSGSQNDLIIRDSTVSRRHCEIRIMPDSAVLRDLGSTNGTIIQGTRVTEAFLDQGTEFQLGNTKIVFCPLRETEEYELSMSASYGRLMGQSVAMRRVFHLAETYSATNSTIHIEGETGTGKEVLASELHLQSDRAEKPFIVIDCASLAQDLVASELFGHTKGAFTGANTDRVGAFEQANGGTVFLDEISDLGPELQPKLLRVLENREVRRVGGNQVRPIDVRVICASNKRLANEVNAGRFRDDLFFRLSVVRIDLPPLRQRKEDIPLLMEKFLAEYLGKDVADEVVDFDKTIAAFRNYDWPGNVRELRNIVEIACHSKRRPLNVGAFLYAGRAKTEDDGVKESFSADRPFKLAKNELIRNFETYYVRDLLARYDGNVSRAARHAGIERAYLQRLIAKLELKR
jgi:DNA-binding NtrC family response regulator